MNYTEDSARTALARQIAREAMVLLRNDGALPLAAGTRLALVGQTQLNPIIGGGGSGASHSNNVLGLREELQRAGLVLEPGFDAYYQKLAAEKTAQKAQLPQNFDFAGLVASGAIYELFGRYTPAEEEPIAPAEVWTEAKSATDTALLIIGRQSGGEECDRRVENDYYLTPSERELVRLTCDHFSKVIVLFDVNGMVDLDWMDDYVQIVGALLMGTCGEQAAGALADLLTGVVSPSGKLAQTAAFRYEDYPTARNISFNKDDPEGILTYESYGLSAESNGSVGFAKSPAVVYEEDIYVGYRYFDSFEEPVLYPFGYGLSYASFAISPVEMAVEGSDFRATVEVTNTSEKYSGREVVQLYVHAPWGEGPFGLKKPWQELRAVAKTPELALGERCQVTLTFHLRDLSSFDETRMRYVLDPGRYIVLIGNSSRHTRPAAELELPREIVTRTVTAQIGVTNANLGKVAFIEPAVERPVPETEGLPRFVVEQIETAWPTARHYEFDAPATGSTLADVAAGKVTMEQFVAQMSLRELAVLCNGYGPGLPFGGMGRKDIPVTIQDENGVDIGSGDHPTAMPGYMNPAIPKYGIHSAMCKDGPASVGKVAWPTGMMLACTFNSDLAREFGRACGTEAAELLVDSWLAPGMNLIRNPIEGRAFEYFSEDPFLTGLMAVEIVKGANEAGVTACPKHFALNEQETYRRGSEKKRIDAVDTIVSGRAARELYLRPFERAIVEGQPRMVMTSFNKINGAFAAGNEALCTGILRGEWGYDGVVVTDWGDMDFVVDGADAVQAGNDVIMPGGPPVIAQVLKGYEEGRVTLQAMREAVAHLMNYLLGTASNNR